MSKLYFGSITIQEKSGGGDFRAFVSCSIDDEVWELRGYGTTVEEAAKDAWEKYQDPDFWHFYGEQLNGSN